MPETAKRSWGKIIAYCFHLTVRCSTRRAIESYSKQTVHGAMLCQDMIILSEGQPTSWLDGILVNTKDDISSDEAGLGAAQSLKRRVAEVAMAMPTAGLSGSPE